MDHDVELVIPILEILEIEVCNILQNPGNIGNLSFSTSSYPGHIGKHIFSLSPILEIVDRTIHICSYVDVAGGRGGSPGVAGGRRGRRSHRGVRGAEPPGGRAGGN